MNELRDRLLAALEGHSAELASISKTLHDDIAQLLSAVGLQLDLLRMDLVDRAPEYAGKVDEIQDILEVVVNKVRDLSHRLGPVRVERIGLRQALDWLVGSRRTGFSGTIRLLFDPAVTSLPQRDYAFYRVADLALDNAIRHSGASLIEVIVKTSRHGPSLEVRDDGVGFDAESAADDPHKLGLALMQFIASKAGLICTAAAGSGKGTVVSLRNPKSTEGAPEI